MSNCKKDYCDTNNDINFEEQAQQKLKKLFEEIGLNNSEDDINDSERVDNNTFRF